MTAFKMLGVSISPAHCKKDDVSEQSCVNGSIQEKLKKYRPASPVISASPLSQTGSCA